MKPVPERRREPRQPASGEVRLLTPFHGEIVGMLADVSARGLRVVHAEPSLATGDEIQFRHAAAAGKARVVWTRILPGRIETGLVILEAG